MFRPAPVKELNIFVSDDDVEDLVIGLAEMNAVDITPVRKHALVQVESEVGHWRGLERRYSSLQRRVDQLFEDLGLEPEEVSVTDLEPHHDHHHLEEQIQELEGEVSDYQDQTSRLEDRIQELEILIEEMRFLEPLELPVEVLRALEHIHLVVGTMPRQNLASLQMSLFRIPYVIIPVHEFDGKVLVFAATTRDQALILDMALDSTFLNPLEFDSEITGKPKQVLEDLRSELEQLREKCVDLQPPAEKYGEQCREDLSKYRTKITRNLKLVSVIENLGRREDVYFMTAWVREEDLDRALTVVEESTGGRAEIEIISPLESAEKQIPSSLKNPRWMKPFERVLNNFGPPSYRDLDPTFFVALTFLLMFGMMFGDVGHGLVLVLVGLLVWRIRDKGELGALLVSTGVSAAGFGFLYGSLFGREDILPHLWIHPMEEILNLLQISVIAGVGLLCLGFILNIWNQARRKNWNELAFGHHGTAGFVFYLLGIGGVYGFFQGIAFPTGLWGMGMAAAVLVLILEEPLGRLLSGGGFSPEESWSQYLVMAPFELFESGLTFLSNSLSFVRLGAFAIAHAGLSRVIYVLAGQAGGLSRWLVIILGNLILVGFEGLVVAIQTLRLEYYEFFGKFFQGEGRKFQAFQLPE